MTNEKKITWISGKLTFPLGGNSLLWQGCTFRVQSNSLRGFDGYGETGKHHLRLRKASQGTRRAPLWWHNCGRCHLPRSLRDDSPSPNWGHTDCKWGIKLLLRAWVQEFTFYLFYKYRLEKESRRAGLLSAWMTLPPNSTMKGIGEIHLSQIHLSQSRILW